jgi:hypothetical protein
LWGRLLTCGGLLIRLFEFVHFVEKVGQTIDLCGLLGWAFGPRNFMKNSGKPRGFPDVRGGLSTLLGWAFGPRNFMKNSGKPRGFPDVRGGFSTLSYLARHSQVWL